MLPRAGGLGIAPLSASDVGSTLACILYTDATNSRWYHAPLGASQGAGMSNTKFALGIDFGTESGRVMLVRADNGEEIAWSQVPYVNGVLDRWLPDDTPLG